MFAAQSARHVRQAPARRTARHWPARAAAAAGLSLALVAAGGAAGAVGPRAMAPAAVGPGAPRPGSPKSGDSLFPFAGNGGYDALHYRVALAYHPKQNRIDAVTRMRARALHPLSAFYLDLSGLHVRSVHVNGRSAHFTRHGHELRIRPIAPVRGLFRTAVVYDGRPRVHIDPDKSQEGWIRTSDGATALGEPVGTMTWIPVNNTPRDKARYTFQVTAPAGLTVAANGVLIRRIRHEQRAVTWTWREPAPMASYLAMVSIGRYRMFHATITSVTGRQIPVWSFVQRGLPSQLMARRLLPRVIRFEERTFGPYPLASVGLVAHRLSVGYALETQERPVFPGAIGTAELVHELAHQWYGDSVTPRDWGDIWLNEGFATYAEWLWNGAHGGPSPAQTFRSTYAKNGPGSRLWSPPPAAFSNPADLFGAQSYFRGAMTLQVLRERVGDAAFFQILRAWARVHQHSGGSTREFIALAHRISGKNLHTLFHDWLFTSSRPTGY